MGFFRTLSAALVALGTSIAIPAAAMPLAPMPAMESGLVVNVNGCHSEARRGYVREFGRTVLHRHRRNCDAVRVDNDRPSRDCHRDVRRHRLPGYGGSVAHRHVGPNCRPRIYRRSDDRRGDCITIGPIRYCEG